MTTQRSLIVLSDGTGNSASKLFKTNVWRLYQALHLSDGRQVAMFGDGVGTSTVSFLRTIGLVFGFGVKRNVINLYKFLCHDYRRDERTDIPEHERQDDRIWMFGFSRGAFTIRVLAGLVHRKGLVKFQTEAELHRYALAAYRAYRKECFPGRPWMIWVHAGRALRDIVVSWWTMLAGDVPYDQAPKQENIQIHFIGVWDTVVAYGLPIDELTIAVDKWVWPMKFDDTSLLERVSHARHALALDDERRTFHPIPWDEHKEKENYGQVDPVRLTQVWFPGMHAEVGGGYPDDGLSFVPLCWMIDEASKYGLAFEQTIVKEYRALATPTGRLYDSRSGFGALWRYQPRNVQFLMDNSDDTVPKEKRITPLVHYSTITRMSYGNDGYAPKSLPFKINILLPDDTRVGFNTAEADALLQNASEPTKGVLTDLKALISTAAAQKDRGYRFALVLDTIWWRRCVYFATLGLALGALALPVIYRLFASDNTEKIAQIEGGAIVYLLSVFKGFIPSYATPWIDAVAKNPPLAVNIVLLFIGSLLISRMLARQIQDRARAAWNVQPRIRDEKLDWLRPAGQRHALVAAVAVLALVAAISLWYRDFGTFASWAALAVIALLALVRRRKKAQQIDAVHPPPHLAFARKVRNSPKAVAAYRWVARTALPAAFILLVAWIALSAANLGIYNLRSTSGAFCLADRVDPNKTEGQRKREARQRAVQEKLGSAIVDIADPCARTGLWLVAGRLYRIQIEPGIGDNGGRKPEFAWFDRGTPADVTGFGPNSFAHVAALTLKRWWRENYFRPIARVGNIGNYEYPLHPAAPLPEVNFSACGKAAAPSDGPAPFDERKKVLDCEEGANIHRNETLLADITPDSTGELYIYVNDAIRFWDRRDNHKFYKNNSGKAKVTVRRTLAPATVEAND
jgi:uncharacterized protein (DUF2235 family)